MIYSKLQQSGAGILIWEITESEDELQQLLLNFNTYREEYYQLKTTKRKLEFLAARVALNVLAGKLLTIIYTPQGKPYVLGKKLNISISHTQKWISVVLHPTFSVGIDIEVPTNKFEKLYQRFLNKREQDALFDVNDLRKVQLAWSAKEALYKIIGNEAVNFDKQLEILDFTLLDTGQIVGVHTVSNKTYNLFYIQNTEFNLVYCVDLI